jgi:hypothetical protein
MKILVEAAARQTAANRKADPLRFVAVGIERAVSQFLVEQNIILRVNPHPNLGLGKNKVESGIQRNAGTPTNYMRVNIRTGSSGEALHLPHPAWTIA